MQVVISGRFTQDVSPETGRLCKEFEANIEGKLTGASFRSPIEGVVLFPTILAPEIAGMRDKVTYKRKEKSVFVALSLSHRRWIAASIGERIDLLADNISASLSQINVRFLFPDELALLLRFVEEVKSGLKRKHSH